MRCRTLVLLIFLFSIPSVINAQSTSEWPKTLLWRISGNGLSKNSFLYGTMHLQDKRLFHFSDSVYHYLEQADGYAMELDMQEFIDSLVQKSILAREDKVVDDEENYKKDDKKYIDSLVREIKLSRNRTARKLLDKLRKKKMNRVTSKEMPTVVDGYLYGMAQKQSKWLGGIEDVQDQLSIYDEFGNSFNSEELLAPDTRLQKTLEEMIQIYISQDIAAIEKYSLNQFNEELEDKLFIQRNKKMALRMDSLANVRSMFFAVGAAHLPGDSGVIKLLRKKGYQVDPVFSPVNIDPVKYVSTLVDMPWTKVEDENRTYEVEMPGKASDLNMYGDYIKMKMHVDITTLTYFMSGSVSSQQEVDLDKIMQAISKEKGSKIENKKKIGNGELKGIEAVMLSGGYYYKIQYLVRNRTLYMLMAGGNKKEILNSEDVKRFFKSFIPKEIVAIKEQKEWQRFSMEDKAFHIMMPDAPKQNRMIEKKAEGSNWKFSVYDLNDVASSVYYLVQVRDLSAGYYLTGDSAFFSLFRQNLPELIDKISREEVTTIFTFPAYRFEAEDSTQNLLYKMLLINRGNRVYTLMAVGTSNDESKKDIDRFFNSFTLTDYKTPIAKTEWDPEGSFYTTLPSAIKIQKEENKEAEEINKTEETEKHYICYNPEETISYEIYKTTLSPYYWVTSDSLFFDIIGRRYKSDDDSILSKRAVLNGQLKGMEWIMQMPQNNNLKKIRQILNGDTLYTLTSFIPTQYINERRHEQFFTSFRAAHEDTAYSIFKNKAKRLLTDIQSTDSATFAKASDALLSADFDIIDKPLLEKALLVDYLDDSSYYYSTRDRLINFLDDMADSTTVEFVRLHFNDKEKNKFNLVDLLARYQTTYSYSVLKELLLKYTPKEKGSLELSYKIKDSIELAKTLYPDILTLSNNTLFAERLISITGELVDSNALSIEMLLPFKENFLYTADTILNKLMRTTDEEFWGGQYTDMINLLGKFNDEDCNAMLQRYLALDDLVIKNEVIINLLKNGQRVNEKEIQLLAADNDYRRSLYEEMKKIGKEKLFPSKYMMQKYMAESDMYVSSYDDDGASYKVKLIGEKEALYKGEKKRFYLFKVMYTYEGEEPTEESTYLGIAGPYSLDPKNMETDKEVTGLYYKANFDSKKVNEQFEEWVQMMQESGD